MAIKGKGKTKNRQPARAPRRTPVPVKPPFFARRWVQLVAALLIGMGIVWFLVWVTNGIRASRDSDQAAKIAIPRIAQRRTSRRSRVESTPASSRNTRITGNRNETPKATATSTTNER